MDEKYLENYSQRFQCIKRSSLSETQTYFSYTNIPLNTLSPNTNFMEVYGNIPTQNINCGQYVNCGLPNNFLEQTETLNWDNRALQDVEKVAKIPDKMEMIEITSKDLSPVSYCSNIDLMPDMYKTNKETDYFNKYDHNLRYYNQNNYNQNNFEYTSCAEINQLEKPSKYCGNQKNQDINIQMNCTFEGINSENNIYYKHIGKHTNSFQDYNNYIYDNKYQDLAPSCQTEQFFNISQSSFEPINHVDQQSEGSNESDIIVEESEEEATDNSEDLDKGLYNQINKCVICNLVYTPLGTQFYYLTKQNPLTMSSQKPVINKIIDLVGNLSTTQNYICSECLGLINTIDHLQLKLRNLVKDMTNKFERTCQQNNIQYKQKLPNRNIKRFCVNKFPKYKCRICKKVLCIKKYCYYHYKKHKRVKHLCEICGNVFTTRKKFVLHYRTHKKVVPKIPAYDCSNCKKVFRTQTNLKEHQNYCLGILPYKCKNPFCDKKFTSSTKLKNHIKLKHDKKFIAICSICNIGFVKVSDYKSHMVTHNTEKKYSCKLCHKSYKTLSNLNFHMKVHNDKLPFICQICKKGFMRKEYLEAHVNNHNGIKNYCCTVCGKKFVSQKNLDAHLKYHEGTVTKNTCNLCGKSMTTGFEEHIRSHNNLREFECIHCNMRFNTKGALKKHTIKKHTQVDQT